MKTKSRPFAAVLMAMTFIVSGAITLPELPDRDQMTVKGYVHDGTNPIGGVYVTDGFSFVSTDADGSYYMATDPQAEFIYVISPKGYNPECTNGLSRFWSRLNLTSGTMRCDFELTPVDDTKHKMIVLGDPQMRDDHDHDIFKTDALPDIKATVKAAKDAGEEVSVLVLGDMCFNNPETFPRYANYWLGLNTPMYHVPGNHDKHIVADVSEQAPEYKATFGPLYYSFDKGDIHYLMIDNIYIPQDGAYCAWPDNAQLEWIMKDLDHVAPGSTVVVCAHQPMTWTATARRENARLLEKLNSFKTLMLTAHKHYGLNVEKHYDNIEERIQSALCGAYWYGDCAKDGIDLGYYIYGKEGPRINWTYKPLKRSAATSMRINDPVIAADGSMTFMVNVFDWDPSWTVSFSVNGEAKGNLENTTAYDPHAYRLYSEHVKTWCRPVETPHIFPVTIDRDSRVLEVTATDRFGQSVSARYEINPEILPDREDTEVKGYVRCDGKGVENVVVTNGYDFTTTNVFGTYYLPRNEKADMVWIVAPSGYDPLTVDGMPAFFKPIERKEQTFQADFELTATGDDIRHRFLAIADPQMRGDHDYEMFERLALPDIQKVLGEIKESGIPCQSLVLGDICFDSWETFPRYLDELKGLTTPFYHVPGNHDKHIVTDASVAVAEYKAAFGPLYYAVNKGKVHYLMFDNVNITARGAYDSAISEDALSWLTKYLSFVPTDNILVVGVHIPVTDSGSTAEANKNFLLNLSKYRTLILSAHRHYGKNLGKYSLSAAADADIEERIHSALCGAYWYGDVAKDGTPLGYYLYDVDGTDISWIFRPLGDDSYGQITIHEPAPFGSRMKVDVNIYDYDSQWNVTWKLDGVDKGRMYNYEAFDPHANELYAEHEKTWCRPAKTKHMFYGYLPADYKKIEVNATDRFGRTHTRVYGEGAGISPVTTDSDIFVSLDGRMLSVASVSPVAAINVFSVAGHGCNMVENIAEMDLTALPSGVYVVEIRTENGGILIQKILLK